MIDQTVGRVSEGDGESALAQEPVEKRGGQPVERERQRPTREDMQRLLSVVQATVSEIESRFLYRAECVIASTS